MWGGGKATEGSRGRGRAGCLAVSCRLSSTHCPAWRGPEAPVPGAPGQVWDWGQGEKGRGAGEGHTALRVDRWNGPPPDTHSQETAAAAAFCLKHVQAGTLFLGQQELLQHGLREEAVRGQHAPHGPGGAAEPEHAVSGAALATSPSAWAGSRGLELPLRLMSQPRTCHSAGKRAGGQWSPPKGTTGPAGEGSSSGCP